MKRIVLIAAMLVFGAASAHATGNHKPPRPAQAEPQRQAQVQQQAQQQAQAIDMSLMTNPAASSSTSAGNTYLLPAPASAAPLPAGICPQGDSESWSVVWGFVSYSRSSTRSEMACLDKLVTVVRETEPQAASAPVVNYIASEPGKCTPPARAASLRPGAKKPGTCG